jgi:hypothetical protein
VLAGEDEVFCPKDCPPCRAIQVFVNGAERSDGQAALASSNDGKTLSLAGFDTVQIQIGSQIHQSSSGSIDFTLVGTVSSSSKVTLDSLGCWTGNIENKGGAFLVEVGDGEKWAEVGYWAQKTVGGIGGGSSSNVAVFSLCGKISTAKYIRLLGQGTAKATLDYVKADSCS